MQVLRSTFIYCRPFLTFFSFFSYSMFFFLLHAYSMLLLLPALFSICSLPLSSLFPLCHPFSQPLLLRPRGCGKKFFFLYLKPPGQMDCRRIRCRVRCWWLGLCLSTAGIVFSSFIWPMPPSLGWPSCKSIHLTGTLAKLTEVVPASLRTTVHCCRDCLACTY